MTTGATTTTNSKKDIYCVYCVPGTILNDWLINTF
jgi:hypothetical protein